MSQRNWEFRTENSVPSQQSPAKSVFAFLKLCDESGIRTCIDVGSGRGRNLIPLLRAMNSKGGKMIDSTWAVDTTFQYERNKSFYEKLSKAYPNYEGFVSAQKFQYSELRTDSAILICVLHVIPWTIKRVAILKNCSSNLVKGGLLFVDVPCGERYYLKKYAQCERYADGYVFGTGQYRTFRKEFDEESLVRLVRRADFKIEKSEKHHRHITLTCSKE